MRLITTRETGRVSLSGVLRRTIRASSENSFQCRNPYVVITYCSNAVYIEKLVKLRVEAITSPCLEERWRRALSVANDHDGVLMSE